jgi:hypothetical protein
LDLNYLKNTVELKSLNQFDQIDEIELKKVKLGFIMHTESRDLYAEYVLFGETGSALERVP